MKTIAALVLLVSVGVPSLAAEKDTQDVASMIAEWPETSQLAAQSMIEVHGKPSRQDATSLTWFGLHRGMRTVVHREGDAVVEQVVRYKVPAGKVDEIARFDEKIKVDREASEMSVRTDMEKTNMLYLNLAHEIASGFKTADEAKEFFQGQMRLADTGKASTYRDLLRFETRRKKTPMPFILPPGANPPRRNELAP